MKVAGPLSDLARRTIPLRARRRLLDGILERLDRHGASGALSYSSAGQDMALRHSIGPGSNTGFYVDVGAWKPKIGSNTYALYRRGWSGLTIEPRSGSASEFRRCRPRDHHLEIGIAPTPGVSPYLVARSPNSSVNSLNAGYMASIGVEVEAEYEVEVDRLDRVLSRWLPPGCTVDLLTIDTEGSDLGVLESNDWQRFRPALVLVEDVEDGDACRFLCELGFSLVAVMPVLGRVRDHLYSDPGRSLYRDY